MNQPLPARIQAIIDSVPASYELIWDTCCDHGLIGLGLINKLHCRVHFVDQVPHICQDLSENLEQQSLDNACYHVICQDVAAMELQITGSQLVIIAGVSGLTCIELVETLRKRMTPEQLTSVDFLLCPNYHLFALREYLNNHQFSLAKEEVVTQNQRCHEILRVSPSPRKYTKMISDTGDEWNPMDNDQHCHLEKLIDHYQQKSNNPADDLSRRALAAYQGVMAQYRTLDAAVSTDTYSH